MKRRKSQSPEALDERAKLLIDEKFPGRGRFGELEKYSKIPLNRWKNFVYGKQKASQEIVDFLCNTYPEEAEWLRTGIEHPEQENFPFFAAVPRKWEGQSIGDRLAWAIKEWASPSGEKLFQYLEEKTNGAIKANDWAQVMLGTQQPTIAMILLVTTYRPHFFEWIIRGRVGFGRQVDPTSKQSIDMWIQGQKEEWQAITQAMKKAVFEKNDDQAS